MNIKIDSLVAPLYKAIAVKAYPKGEIAERDVKNEIERKGTDGLSGSDRLLSTSQAMLTNRSHSTSGLFIKQKHLPTTFATRTEICATHFPIRGLYRVKLKVSSNGCNYTDSLNVKVLDSSLEVPIFFTPNGDGVNDEFKVAYKSLRKYHC